MAVSVSAKVTRTGPSIDELMTNVKLLQALSVKELDRLAKQVSSDFRYYINHSRHRPGQYNKNSLANAFTDSGVVVLPDGSVSVGIGNIAELDANYKYWKFVNYGGTPPRTMGYFGHGEPPDPGLAGVGTQVFHHRSAASAPFAGPGGKTSYLLTPGPIRAMNYIEKVTNKLTIRWGNLREKYFSTLQK